MKLQKILYLLVGLLLVFNPVFCQKKEVKVVQTECVVGKNLITGSEIKAAELLFPEKIYKTFLDTATNLLTVQLKGLDSWDGATLKNRGTMVQYDTEKDTVLWKKKINYPRSTILQSGSTIIHTTLGLSNKIDVYTGKKIWEVERKIVYLDPISNIAIGYFPGNLNELYGINFSNSKYLWYRRINNEYGWNNYSYLNDSTLLVAASGLHTFNINTGHGWDYNTITGNNADSYIYNAFMMQYLFGLVGGLIYGLVSNAFTDDNPAGIAGDIISNTLMNYDAIYFASKEEIVKIDKQSGRILWKNSLPKNITSKSSLFMNDTTVYMVNYGYAYIGDRAINYGNPFIAAFDEQSGKQRYLTVINEKNYPIQSFDIAENDFYCVFTDKLTKFNLETGKFTSEKAFSNSPSGALKCFANNRVFVNDAYGNLISPWESDFTKLYIFNENDHLLTINNEFNVTGTIAKKDIWTYFLSTESYRLFFNNFSEGRKTILTNNLGQKIAELDVSPSAFILNNILYDNRDKSFIAIDLNQIP